MAHLRIEVPPHQNYPHIGGEYDRIYAVGDDGQEVDVSSAISSWTALRKAGELFAVTFEVLGVELALIPEGEWSAAQEREQKLRGVRTRAA